MARVVISMMQESNLANRLIETLLAEVVARSVTSKEACTFCKMYTQEKLKGLTSQWLRASGSEMF